MPPNESPLVLAGGDRSLLQCGNDCGPTASAKHQAADWSWVSHKGPWIMMQLLNNKNYGQHALCYQLLLWQSCSAWAGVGLWRTGEGSVEPQKEDRWRSWTQAHIPAVLLNSVIYSCVSGSLSTVCVTAQSQPPLTVHFLYTWSPTERFPSSPSAKPCNKSWKGRFITRSFPMRKLELRNIT